MGNVEAAAAQKKYLHAADIGDLEQVKALLSGGLNVNSRGENRETALHVACRHNHLELVKYLLSNGAKLHAKDNYKATPLHWACGNGHLDLAIHLLSQGANLQARDKIGATPMDYTRDDIAKRKLQEVWRVQVSVNSFTIRT